MRRSCLVVLACAVTLTCLSPTHADSSADEAEFRFRRGASFYKAGRFDEALAEFFASNRLAPNRNVVFNLARCFEALARFDEAYRYYADYLGGESSAAERTATERKLVELAPKVALIRVESDPPGATVYLDRKDLGGRGETPLSLAYAPGPHAILIELPGYTPSLTEVELVRGREIEVHQPLALITGSITVRSRPAGRVYVDRAAGDLRPATAPSSPATIKVPPGRHTVEIVAPDHLTYRSEVVVRPDIETSIVAELERRPPPSGTVVLQANVRGALVLVDGLEQGFTPAVLSLLVGDHEVEVRSAAHQPWRRAVAVDRDGHAFLEAELIEREAEVVGATRAIQTVSSAPASVTLISREELQAFGYATLTDALASVRGLYASDDRNYETVGVRGFSRPGDYNNRVLLMRDGHSINDDWIGSAAAGRDLAPDLEDVERIEVIRGPGSTFYGAGAFFGVINLVSREADAGPPVSAGGELDSAGGGSAFVHGQLRGPVGSMVIHASAFDSSGRDFESEEFEATPSGGVARGADGEDAQRIAIRSRVGALTLHGSFARRRKDLPTAPYGTAFDPGDSEATGDLVTQTLDRRGFVEGVYERSAGPARWTARLAYDYQGYDGLYAYAEGPDDPDAFVFADAGGGHWLTAEARVALAVLGQRFTLGAEGVHHRITQSFDEEYDGVDEYLDRHRFETGSLYALDEIGLGDRVQATVGLRLDRFGAQQDTSLSPRLAVVATPYGGGNSKLVLGRAFRSPSVYELRYNDGGITQVAPDSLESEAVWTAELEHSHALGRRSYLLGSVFASRISNLIGLTSDDDEILIFANSSERVTAIGGELEARVTAASGAWLSGAVSATRLVSDDRSARVNSAPVVGAARGFWPVDPGLAVAAEVIYNAPRPLRDSDVGVAGGRSDRAVVADLFATQRLGKSDLSLRAGVTNLLDWSWAVPVGEEYVQREIAQRGRTLVVQVRYQPR